MEALAELPGLWSLLHARDRAAPAGSGSREKPGAQQRTGSRRSWERRAAARENF